VIVGAKSFEQCQRLGKRLDALNGPVGEVSHGLPLAVERGDISTLRDEVEE